MPISNPSKHARVGEDELPGTIHFQNQVFVPAGLVIRRLEKGPPRHAEMHPQPVGPAEDKEHLFAVAFRAGQRLADKMLAQPLRVLAAEDPLISMEANRRHQASLGGQPLLPVIFDFSEFGHEVGRKLFRESTGLKSSLYFSTSVIIDCHTHCYPAKVVADPRGWATQQAEPHWAELVAPQNKRSIQGWATPEQMLEAMDQAGVAKAALLGWYWENESTCRWHNEVISEWCECAPERLIGFAAVYPNKAVIDQLEYARSLGLCGVGELHPGVQGFDSASASWHALGDWCTAQHWPVNFHTSRPSGDHPLAVATPMEDYLVMIRTQPKLNFIFAHWGAELPERLQDAPPPNVYYDCSASPLLYGMDRFRRMIEWAGEDKLLFGSDYPLRIYPRQQKEPEMHRFIGQIQNQAALSPEESEALFHKNFQELLAK